MATDTKYFSKFKQITYGNTAAIDITQRAVQLKTIQSNPYIFYPLDVVNDTRPDQISYAAYEDPYYSWSLYLINNITDPYYEWYMSDRQFTNFIKDKYGDAVYDTHHYEDSNGHVVMGGYPVSNREYEERLNEKKRRIKIISYK
mgnify:CR=1 FL=1